MPVLYLLILVMTTISLGGCSAGWYGTTANLQELQIFTNKSKREIIEAFASPDNQLTMDGGAEYWLYKSNHFSYILVFGAKKEKGVIFKFEDDSVSTAFHVDEGEALEIATRGWEYLDYLEWLTPE